MKSTCITGILEAEAAYMMDVVIRFIDATMIWYFRKRFIALQVLPTHESIALIEEQKLVNKIPDNITD